MNKLLTKAAKLLLGLSLAAGVGVAVGSGVKASQTFAADQVFYTLTPAAGTNNSYTGNCDVAITGITWNVTGNSTMTPWRLGGKSISNTDRAVYSKTAMGSAITKVELTVGNASSITVNSLKLIVGSNSSFSTTTDTVTKSFSANSTITFNPTSGTEWATGSYYKFVFNVTVSGSSNKFVEFSSAKFYCAQTESYTVSFNANGGTGTMSSVPDQSGSYTLPANGFTAPENKVFAGWKANNAGDIIAAGGSYTLSSDITFYAQWADAYTVTYTAGTNGSGSFSHTMQPAGSYTLLPFANLTGVSANTGFKFKNYTVSGVDKNPGDTITLSAATSVSVNFQEKPLETTYDFTTNFGTYASSWTNSYGDHTGLNGKTDIGGDYTATIDLHKASKQTGTITTMPVFATKTESGSWYQAVHFTLTETGYKIKEVQVTFAQWGTKTPDIALFKGNSVSGTPLDSGTVGTKNTISTSNLNGTDFSVGYCDKSTSNVQAGISSIYITLEALASFGTLDHITITGMPNNVYHIGETFDATGLAVTAYDGANEATANFKDVTASVETDLDDPTPFVDADVPGFDCDVQYTEGGNTKTTSFHVYVYALAEYELVTEEQTDWSGTYLIVSTNHDSDLVAMNGGLTDPDVENGYKVVTDTAGTIEAGQELEWTVAKVTGGYSIQGKSGKYIGSLTSASNGMLVGNSAYVNTIEYSDADGATEIKGTNNYHLKLFVGTGTSRFRYYSSGNVQLYKLVESSNAIAYAETFLGAFTCDASGVNAPTFTIKEGSTYWTWALLATEYNTLTAVEKEEFRFGVAYESGDEIAQALARYDYVVGKYCTATYSDFMSRNPAQIGGVKLALGAVNENTNTIAIIVIISLVSVTDIGGYFFIRRRKVN